MLLSTSRLWRSNGKNILNFNGTFECHFFCKELGIIMDLTGKQKRFLRSLGNNQVHEIVVGHGGLSENFFNQFELVLTKEELVKIRLQPSSGIEVAEAAKVLCEKSNSELVQVFGRTVLIYRKSGKKGKILLPE